MIEDPQFGSLNHASANVRNDGLYFRYCPLTEMP